MTQLKYMIRMYTKSTVNDGKYQHHQHHHHHHHRRFCMFLLSSNCYHVFHHGRYNTNVRIKPLLDRGEQLDSESDTGVATLSPTSLDVTVDFGSLFRTLQHSTKHCDTHKTCFLLSPNQFFAIAYANHCK